MRVEVLFFAGARLVIGNAVLDMSLPDGATAGSLLHQLATEYPAFAGIAAITQTAVNEEYVPKSHVLCDGDTVAIIPPVSGGSGTQFAKTNQPGPANCLDDAGRRSRIMIPTMMMRVGALFSFDRKFCKR